MFTPYISIQHVFLLLVVFPSTIRASDAVQFTYQSHTIKLTEWISLLTLCLAPLVAHIFAGVPGPIHISLNGDRGCKPIPPTWRNRLGHFNPISIIWRYYIITNRRVLARNWSPINMAASCALFWTHTGWDGSEEMMIRSRIFCTRVPARSRISFASVTAATTIIVTIQGIQSVYDPLAGFFNGQYGFALSFPTMFLTLAFLGLLRLPAALWLTDDFSYMDIDAERSEIRDSRSQLQCEDFETIEMDTVIAANAALLHVESGLATSINTIEMFRPANSWRGFLVKAVFLTPLVGLVVLCAASAAQSRPEYEGLFFTGTHLALVTLYLALLPGFVTLSYYFYVGNTHDTVIPCIEKTWYKVYTGVLIVLAIGAMVVSGLETRRSSCGIYTSLRPYYDKVGCHDVR